MQDECRDLVLLAAPKDSRAYFEYPDSAGTLYRTVADYQRAAGLEGVLVDAYAREGTGVTVTGWLAVACLFSLMAVALGSAGLAYRSYLGYDGPIGARFVKDGTA